MDAPRRRFVIGRRLTLAGISALGLAHRAFSIAPESDQRFPDLRFDVLRNGGPIGHHSVTFHQDGGTLTANTAVDIEVRLGSIVLYRYAQTAREFWRDGEFDNLVSETNDGGKHHAVRVARSGDRLVAQVANTAPAPLPTNAIPMTHWNILCLERPLFDVIDGSAIESKVVPRGEDTVKLADGQTLRAAHYALQGKIAVDTWYDDSRHWASLRLTGSDGSTIEYRRVA